MTRPQSQPGFMFTEPPTVGQISNKYSYKLHLPKTIWNQDVFLLLPLAYSHPPVSGMQSSESQLAGDKNMKEWVVEWIIDCKQRTWILHYHVEWAGSVYIWTIWKLCEHLVNEGDIINKFHWDLTKKLQGWRSRIFESGGPYKNGDMQV